MTQEDYINLIFKYLAKTISSDEKILLLKWLEEDKSHRDIFASAAAIRSASRINDEKADVDSMMSRLNARIDADNHIEKKSTKALTWTKRVALVSTAAAIAALAYIGFLGGDNGPAADSRNFIAYRNNSEDISAVEKRFSSAP